MTRLSESEHIHDRLLQWPTPVVSSYPFWLRFKNIICDEEIKGVTSL